MHVRKGDTVLVIAGNDKGRTGTIMEVLRERNRVVVEGVNLRWKHRKPTQQSPKGERVQRESAIHASNVLHVDPESGKGLRRRPEVAAQKSRAKKTTRGKKTAKAEKTTAKRRE